MKTAPTRFAISMAFSVALIATEPAAAGLIISAQDAQVPFSLSSQTGSFEVFVQSDLSTPPQLIADQVRLLLSPASSGVTLTSVSTTSVHPYVFAPQTPSGSVSGGGAILDAGDFLLSGSDPLNDGAGLFKVTFAVAAATLPGSFAVQISTNANDTMLIDNASSHLSFSTHNGTITIAVPEPTSATLLVLALAILLSVELPFKL